MSNVSERPGIITGYTQCVTRKIECNASVSLGIFDLSNGIKDGTAISGIGHSLAEVGVQFDGLFEEKQRAMGRFPLIRTNIRQSTKKQIIRSKVVGRPLYGAFDFGSLQCRFNDSGNTRRHPVLEVKDILKRTVKPVGPQMGTGLRLDQLRGDTHPTTAFAHRSLKQIAHAQFASYLLQIERC